MHRVEPTSHVQETLAQVEELYGQSRFLDAHAAGQVLGPLPQWPGASGLILAGRLARMLGALPVTDLTVEDPPLEEVLSELFRSSRKAERVPV